MQNDELQSSSLLPEYMRDGSFSKAQDRAYKIGTMVCIQMDNSEGRDPLSPNSAYQTFLLRDKLITLKEMTPFGDPNSHIRRLLDDDIRMHSERLHIIDDITTRTLLSEGIYLVNGKAVNMSGRA